jgi:hypothetical protein
MFKSARNGGEKRVNEGVEVAFIPPHQNIAVEAL